jgi:hypothetical protein
MLWTNGAEGYTRWRALLRAILHDSKFLRLVLLIMLSLHFMNTDNLSRSGRKVSLILQKKKKLHSHRV